VKHCLGKLKGGFRQVVYLTFYEGLAYPEIAATLDIPTGTVKTRMMQAKRLLEACLSRLLPQAESTQTEVMRTAGTVARDQSHGTFHTETLQKETDHE
jgi:hypothetical protein